MALNDEVAAFGSDYKSIDRDGEHVTFLCGEIALQVPDPNAISRLLADGRNERTHLQSPQNKMLYYYILLLGGARALAGISDRSRIRNFGFCKLRDVAYIERFEILKGSGGQHLEFL